MVAAILRPIQRPSWQGLIHTMLLPFISSRSRPKVLLPDVHPPVDATLGPCLLFVEMLQRRSDEKLGAKKTLCKMAKVASSSYCYLKPVEKLLASLVVSPVSRFEITQALQIGERLDCHDLAPMTTSK